MIFQKQLKAPVLICIGMMFLAIALLWPKFLHPASTFGQNLSDGVCGLMFGLSIGINLCAMILASRQRRCSGN